jgi:hypothetical protein
MRSDRVDLATDPMTIKRIIMEYCEQLFGHTFDNLLEMDQFLERDI